MKTVVLTTTLIAASHLAFSAALAEGTARQGWYLASEPAMTGIAEPAMPDTPLTDTGVPENAERSLLGAAAAGERHTQLTFDIEGVGPGMFEVAGKRSAMPDVDRIAQNPPAEGPTELEKANQAIANPLAQATLFIQEFNTVFLDGDLADDSKVTGIYALDPLVPVPLTNEWNVILRPIIPVAVGGDLPVAGGSAGPVADPLPTFENVSGLGDISFFTLFTKNTASPFKFGAGPAFRFPTATDDRLGAEKFSVGAATVGLYSSPNFTLGVLNQNYFSVAGPNGADDVSVSTFQYFAFYNFTPAWGIGTAPTIAVDWDADDDKLLLPVGLGIAHTFRIGEIPTRLLLEGQYYAIQRDAFGPEWNLRVALAMFLPPLLSQPAFE